MAEVSDPKKPTEMSASIPPLKDIIIEGNHAIATQARAAVAKVLANGGFADPDQLRKWGPRGATYFFDLLQKRIADKPTRQKAVEPAINRWINRLRAENVCGQLATQKVFRRKRPPLSTQHDWASRQHNRWATPMRAIARGMLVAAVLFAAAAVLIHLSPTLVPLIQQHIQTWR